jgi:dystonin
LESLLAFMQLAAQELAWLNEKEELEVSRDWSSQTLNMQELEDYLEVFLP